VLRLYTTAPASCSIQSIQHTAEFLTVSPADIPHLRGLQQCNMLSAIATVRTKYRILWGNGFIFLRFVSYMISVEIDLTVLLYGLLNYNGIVASLCPMPYVVATAKR
jgi:hypothetical protein